ncbi:MAG: WD40 repeat domain-containing protein, partial [Planctomycetes bacterium]|nr:WD40 repeat domain-containing protein [Planctomycetota bacterium]
MRRPLGIAPFILAAAGLAASPAPADRRGDPLPEGAAARLGTLRFLYPGGVADVDYLPDGRIAVLVGGRIDIWDAERRNPPERHAVCGTSLRSIAPIDGGRILLLADAGGRVREWDAAERRERRSWHAGQEGLVQAIASPDETRILTVGSNPPTLREWDRKTGELRIAIGDTGTLAYFTCAAYGPSGETAWAGGGHAHVLAEFDLRA